jgi:hypothetical protein
MPSHRWRRVFLVVALSALSAGLCVGCGSGASKRRSVISELVPTTPWCQARTNATWKKALIDGLVTLSRRASVQPLAVANDGRAFYATLFTKAYSGIVRIDAKTSRFTEIRRVPHLDAYQALGSADGRWLVWLDTTTPYWTKWAIWSWDSRTGRVRQIAATPRAPHAQEWASASTPSVRNGYVTWAQGIGPGETEVKVVDLASSRSRVIRRGSAAQPFLLPSHVLIWVEDVRTPNGKKPVLVLRAASAVTGKRIPLPRWISDLRGLQAASLMSDGKVFAHTAGPPASLWWSPSLAFAPSYRVFTAKGASSIDNSLGLAGIYVYFGVQPRAYLANGAEGRYLQIGPSGYAIIGRNALVYLKPSPVKAAHAIADVVFLPLASLPAIPPCSQRASSS